MQLSIRDAKSEKFFYNCAKFPSFFGSGSISDFPNSTALCHWHDDVEFTIVQKGSMDYSINGETVRIFEGEGIFINSRQLHYNFARDGQEGEYLCVLLHPVLLCASSYVEEALCHAHTGKPWPCLLCPAAEQSMGTANMPEVTGYVRPKPAA